MITELGVEEWSYSPSIPSFSSSLALARTHGLGGGAIWRAEKSCD